MKIGPLLVAACLLFSAPAAFAGQHATPEKIQERNTQLQKLMDQAQQARTPAERQATLAQYMGLMQLQMAAMKEMLGTNGTAGAPQPAAQEDEAGLQMQATMQSMMQMFMQMMMQVMMQNMQQLMQQPPRT